MSHVYNGMGFVFMHNAKTAHIKFGLLKHVFSSTFHLDITNPVIRGNVILLAHWY